MPTLAQQRTSAIEHVRIYAQITVEPAVDENGEEFDAIIDRCQRASIWTVATAYIVGQEVLPTVRNGHRYICIQAGTSDADSADEPDWSLAAGRINGDGASDPQLLWQENGPDYENVFDTSRAIHDVWMLKAAKASPLYATRQSGSSFEHQQVYEHCIKMAERYAPVRMA